VRLACANPQRAISWPEIAGDHGVSILKVRENTWSEIVGVHIYESRFLTRRNCAVALRNFLCATVQAFRKHWPRSIAEQHAMRCCSAQWPGECLKSREDSFMQGNKFEDSRVAEGTMLPGAQHITNTTEKPANSTAPENGKGYAVSETPDSDPRNQENRTRRVLGAGTLKGDRVRNTAGDDLGKIEEIMIDLGTGRVAYAVLSFGGFLGIGDKLFAVPWNALRVDQSAHEFVLDTQREALENAPGFDKDNWPDMADPGYGSEIHRHYGQTPYWEVTVVDVRDDTANRA
jgi:sporulation protein YlmC with PRC-barrel domain